MLARRNSRTPANDRLQKQIQKPKIKSVVRKAEDHNQQVLAAITSSETAYFDKPAGLAVNLSSFEGKNMLHFIADTGACEYMVNDASVFAELRTLSAPITITCANKDEDASLHVSQVGNIMFTSRRLESQLF